MGRPIDNGLTLIRHPFWSRAHIHLVATLNSTPCGAPLPAQDDLVVRLAWGRSISLDAKFGPIALTTLPAAFVSIFVSDACDDVRDEGALIGDDRAIDN